MADPLRILVVGVSWPPETFLSRLFRGLLAAGIDVTVACASRPDRTWMTEPQFRWRRTRSWRGSALLRMACLGVQTCGALFRDPYMCVQTLLGLRNTDILGSGARARLPLWNRLAPLVGCQWDVVYFPWNGGAIAHLPLFEWGMPVVISCRGSHVNVRPCNPEQVCIRDGLRVTLQRAAAVHCVSRAMQEEIRKYEVDAAKVWTIRPAIDPAFFVPGNANRPSCPQLRVVTTGSLIWLKGYEYALQAIRLLVEKDVPVQLDIIGDGPERQRVLYTIHDLFLQDHVRLFGKLSPDEVVSRLQQSDVFLLSSLSEGISNAVLEAMACGLPVVTTDCGGMREAVTDGIEGYVVPKRAPAAMAAALEQLWKSPDQRVAMGIAGRRRIEQAFSLDGQVSQFAELLMTAAGRRPAEGSRTTIPDTASCAD